MNTRKEQPLVQRRRTTRVNDVSAALEGEDEYRPAFNRMEGSEDEANQTMESGATAVTRSELDMWEAARASDSSTSITNALQQEVQELILPQSPRSFQARSNPHIATYH